MARLTLEELEQICQLVLQADLEDEALEQELIDHISCEVEHAMDSGLAFPQAFHTVVSPIDCLALQKVEQDKISLIRTGKRLKKEFWKNLKRTILWNLASFSIFVPAPAFMYGLWIFLGHVGGFSASVVGTFYLIRWMNTWIEWSQFKKELKITGD